LYDAAASSARAAGASHVAAPLGAAPELVRLVLARVDANVTQPRAAKPLAPAGIAAGR
jgi:hypothetical protein